MTQPMTDDERRTFLAGIGLNADAPALAADVPADAPAKAPKVKKAKKAPKPQSGQASELPTEAERRAMPASEIMFDAALVEHFDLDTQLRAASQHLFDLYKSPSRDRERNGLLHRRITEFLGQQRRARKAGVKAPMKDHIKVTREQRDIARLLAEHNITLADLGSLLGGTK